MKAREEETGGTEARKRILGAALSAFMEGGYAQTSTLEIATRARVSKRELYALFGNKEAMLVACITERAQRLKAPADLPELRDRKILTEVLTAFGTRLLTETTDPVVVGGISLGNIRNRARAKGGASAGHDRPQAHARCIARDHGQRQISRACRWRSRRDDRKIFGPALGRPDDRPAASGGRSSGRRRDRATGAGHNDGVPANLSGARLGPPLA